LGFVIFRSVVRRDHEVLIAVDEWHGRLKVYALFLADEIRTLNEYRSPFYWKL
jgi:hypothetical protein